MNTKSRRGNVLLVALFVATLTLVALPTQVAKGIEPPPSRDQLRNDYAAMQAGMFIHYNLSSYIGTGSVDNPFRGHWQDDEDYELGQWAPPTVPRDRFNPGALLDTDQWATTARAAGFGYGILTAKHHNGFALWDTAVSDHDVFNTAWGASEQLAGRSPDVLARYANSFRAQGLKVGLYYSIWDRTADIDWQGNNVTNGVAIGMSQTDYVKAQLTELLGTTSGPRPYGEITSLWVDGWDWDNITASNPAGRQYTRGPGYTNVDYEAIYNHIRTISPNTLLINNGHRVEDMYDSSGNWMGHDDVATNKINAYTDLIHFEQHSRLEDHRQDVTDGTLKQVIPRYDVSWPVADGWHWFWNSSGDNGGTGDVGESADRIAAANREGGVAEVNFGPNTNGVIAANHVEFAERLGQILPLARRMDENIAQGMEVKLSAAGSYDDSAATNGLFKGKSSSNDYVTSDFLQVDLEALEEISEIHLISSYKGTANWGALTIDLLDENGDLVATSGSFTPGDTMVASWDLDSAKSGQFIRVTRGGGNFKVAEVMALVPEPSTFTLSLFSLATVCCRATGHRRRGN